MSALRTVHLLDRGEATRHRHALARLATLIAIGLLAGHAAAETLEETLLARLQQGGLVIALAAAEHGPGRAPPRPPPDCAEGSQLTDAGWQDALAIGVGLRKQRVFVERVDAGPGCAARHTAYLAFGADRVHHVAEIAASCTADPGERAVRRAALTAHLAARSPWPRTNLAVVVDACNLRDLTGPGWPPCASGTQPGDALVVDPVAGRPPQVIGCLPADRLRHWSRLPG